ncbi:MAG: hypothetical protein R3C10_23185 [Pirellulales bacterium]
MAATGELGSRRVRYSLRTLLVLMLAAGLFFAWFTPRMQRARRQGAAVAALKDAKLPVTFGYDTAVGGSQRAPHWARRWLGDDFFSPVVVIDWQGPYALMVTGRISSAPPVPTAEDFALLGEFTELRELTVSTKVPNQGLAAIGQLGRLERLTLSDGDRGWGGSGCE